MALLEKRSAPWHYRVKEGGGHARTQWTSGANHRRGTGHRTGRRPGADVAIADLEHISSTAQQYGSAEIGGFTAVYRLSSPPQRDMDCPGNWILRADRIEVPNVWLI
jgi:hypothetical protein